MRKKTVRGQKYPEPTVGAVILNKKGEVLFIRSPKWFGRLTLPGGHVELGETLEEAVEREAREETGLKVKVKRLLNVDEMIYSKEFFEPRHFIFFDYLCSLKGGRAKVDGREATEFIWVKPGKAVEMDLDSFTRRTLSRWLGERK